MELTESKLKASTCLGLFCLKEKFNFTTFVKLLIVHAIHVYKMYPSERAKDLTRKLLSSALIKWSFS